MASTPGGAVSATVVGRALSVMFLPPSVLILNVADMDCVWRVNACATADTRDPTVSKVLEKKGSSLMDWKQLVATYLCVKLRGDRHSPLVKQSLFSTPPSR